MLNSSKLINFAKINDVLLHVSCCVRSKDKLKEYEEKLRETETDMKKKNFIQ